MTATADIDTGGVRALLPATATTACLNTGTTGPLPVPAAEAMAREAAEELATSRANMQKFMDAFERAAALRTELAGLVGAAEGEIALTRSTTEGVNVVLRGMPWQPGDEVVTTTVEHGGVLLPLYVLHHERGVKLTYADVGHGDAATAIEALREAIRPGVKLVALSHVAYGTGAVLPLREVAELAHAAGVPVLVDGAQSVGAIPVDVRALGVDYYAFPGQKWLCGPDGTGGLYISRERFGEILPTSVWFGGVDFHAYRPNDADSLKLAEGADRYEAGAFYHPVISGFAASVAWLTKTLGMDAVHAATQALTRHCLARVAELPGVEVLTPAAQAAGLVAFRVPGIDPAACVEHLAEQGVSIRSVPDNGALRISCGFFNTREEIDRTVALIGDWASARQ
jgi:L-cysteine/cystine lyase